MGVHDFCIHLGIFYAARKSLYKAMTRRIWTTKIVFIKICYYIFHIGLVVKCDVRWELCMFLVFLNMITN